MKLTKISVIFLTGLLIFPAMGINLLAKSDLCPNVTIHIYNANPGRKTITVTGIRFWDPVEEKYIDDSQITEPFSIDYLDFRDQIRDLPHLKKKKTTIAVIFQYGTVNSLKQKGEKFISYSEEIKCKKNTLIRVDIDGNHIKPFKEEVKEKPEKTSE